MDQIKIGKFIQICRKEKNLTQSGLAEKLNVTNKAISRIKYLLIYIHQMCLEE